MTTYRPAPELAERACPIIAEHHSDLSLYGVEPLWVWRSTAAKSKGPSDPDERAALAEMAGLTADERRALDQWCHLMAIERAAQRRRALEQSSEWAMP